MFQRAFNLLVQSTGLILAIILTLGVLIVISESLGALFGY